MGPKKMKEMDEAAKRAAGSPGYDDDTLEAIKELKSKEKRGELTSSEEKELDRLNRKMIRQSGAERAEDMAKPEKPQRLTEKQKKEVQESLNFKKGGMANCGASVKPAGGSRNK
jgi:hypothetical protein